LVLRTMGRAAEGRSGVRAAAAKNTQALSPPDPNTVFLAAFFWVILALAAIGLKSTLGSIAKRRRNRNPAPSH
jgi:hypothetical protein